MASVAIKFPAEFVRDNEKWSDYKERFLCALFASGMKLRDEQAKTVFLSQCGKEMYALIASLVVPRRPIDKDLDSLLEILDKFFEPELNEIIEAGKFHMRVQGEKESVQDFIAGVSALANKCKFVDLKRQLRDRLVLGVRDKRLQRDLLKVKNLTFEAAVQMCYDYQSLELDVTSARCQNPYTSTELMEVDALRVKWKCKHCAKSHKEGEKCSFASARCNYCKKVGHIVAACRKAQNKIHSVDDEQQEDEFDKTEPETSDKETVFGIYYVSHKIPPFQTTLMINNRKVQMELDTGAARSIMSQSTYKHIFQNKMKLNATDLKLMTWSHQQLKVIGVAQVKIQLGKKMAEGEILIVAGDGPSLLGRDWMSSLNIDLIGLNHLDLEMNKWLEKFPKVFKQGIGEYNGPSLKLNVKQGSVPKFMKARPIPFAMKNEVNKELQRLVDTKVLEPIEYSEWASPLRVVRKEDGSLRICGDYRSTVNTAVDTDTYPMPTPTEALTKLSGGKIFTKIDLCQAYTQIKTDETTSRLLTLNTPLGLMKVLRMPYGINAAPGKFQRLISSVFSKMEGVAVMLDDIAISGKDETEHNQRVEQVLSKLNEMGLTVNSKKCIFAVKKITFLGFEVDEDGIHPSPEKVREIKEKEAPKNKTELRAFLGLYNFYERFLPDRSTILRPLYNLLEIKTPFKWSETEQEAFQIAKDMLTSDMTLVHYDINRELVLICDSSDYGVGAIISHVMDDKVEKPIMMSSRTLLKHERKYGQVEKEALAIMFGLKKFHPFLSGRHFRIVTDHKPLLGLFSPNKAIPDQISPKMLRWALKLSSYDYEIEYRPGKEIGNADALSRWVSPTQEREDVEVMDINLLNDDFQRVKLTPEVIAKETSKDLVLKKVSFHVVHGWPRDMRDETLKAYWLRREALSLNNDCLLWSNRVVIPDSLRKKVLQVIHMPHAGIVQSKAYARGYVYWPEMDKEIERVVAECENCQMTRNNPVSENHSWVIPEKPWSRVHIDFAGPVQGKIFLLLIDAYSKWMEVKMMTSMTSAAVIIALRNIFATQELPEVLVSDNQSTFCSEEFNEFLKKNQIRHLYSPPYNPSTNGQIERAVQTFKNKLKKMTDSEMPWSEKLDKILYYLRTVPNSVTNKTPAEMLNGRKFRTALSILHPSTMSKNREQNENEAQRVIQKKFNDGESVLFRMYGPGEKWCRGVIEGSDGRMCYWVRNQKGELHRRHTNQILARAVRAEAHAEADEQSPDERIIIPPPEMWRDIIGVPDDSDG